MFLFQFPVMILLMFVPTAEMADASSYKEVGKEANLNWVEMLIVDTVRKDNNFESVTLWEIENTALDFMDLQIKEYEKVLDCDTPESDDDIDPITLSVIKKGHSHNSKCYDLELLRTRHSQGSSIRSTIESFGYDADSMKDIMKSIDKIDQKKLYSATINYRDFEDLIYYFSEQKQQWARDLLISNAIPEMYGELVILPDHIDVTSSGYFAFPTPTLNTITSPFGYRSDPLTKVTEYHTGIDISGANATGEPIIASADGVVVHANFSSKAGFFVKIKHEDGSNIWYTRYLHMLQLNVSEGDTVVQGDVIGAVGNTGRSTGPHLHFELYYGNQIVDPFTYISTN